MIKPAQRSEIEAFLVSPTILVDVHTVRTWLHDVYFALCDVEERPIKHAAARQDFKQKAFLSALAGLWNDEENERRIVLKAHVIAELSAAEFFDEKQPSPPPTSIPPQRRKEE